MSLEPRARRLARVAAAALALSGLGCAIPLRPPALPTAGEVHRFEFPDQGWSDAERHWFHHVSQGTATPNVPYEWFLALEQPRLSPFEQPLLARPDYLSRFGFLPSPVTPGNPDGLPIGFARQDAVIDDWEIGESSTGLGFTCAACHTGQLEYRGTAIRVEGGPALTDLGKFRSALGLALGYTRLIPSRFERFAERVLGPGSSREQRQELKRRLRAAVDRGLANPELRPEVVKGSTEEGFARLDALGRIGNFVFGVGMAGDNVRPLRAPVNYPHLWDAPWFDWVQYNASIRSPMVRNAGEALGVFGRADWMGRGGTRFRSSVRVENLHALEEQLAGSTPLRGLRPPRWPAHVLGEIDASRAAAGEDLYRELCKGCHLPPLASPEIQDARYWEDLGEGRRLLKLSLIDIAYVGTDPNQARDMVERTVDASALGITESRYGWALGEVVQAVVTRWYDDQQPPTPDDVRFRMDGGRPPGPGIRAPLAYKARPLDGIWATPPYLHNGSVPDLYALLSPGEERPRSIWLGNREFDPVRVGYVHDVERRGYTRLRAPRDCGAQRRTDGNCNRGHEFRDAPKGGGVIGRALSHEERMALIEYLKTL